MKSRTLALAAALVSGALATSPSLATDVGVSIQISQPGIYGRIDIGQFPKPQLVVTQPVVIERPPQRDAPRIDPVYLWVPPGHRKDWRRHCRAYNACGVPVLFVDDRWYDEHVHPRGRGKGHGKGHDKGHDKGHGKPQGKGHGD